MDYIKIRFSKDLGHIHSQLHATFEEMFRRVNPVLVLSGESWRPQMDIYETPDEVVVIAEISGVATEDLEVELDQKAVRIRGNRRQPPCLAGMKYHLAEIAYGGFDRILMLPVLVDPEAVQASCGNGLLKIVISKARRHRVQRIPIDE